MSTHTKHDSRLNFRLPPNLKAIIEQAAATLGQSVSDFAVSTLVEKARTVLQQESLTELSRRDRDVFIALLDDTDARPNKALADAARSYKKHRG